MKELRIWDSEWHKIIDATRAAMRYHERRDEMNSEVHLARTVRYSPLTVELQAAIERADALFDATDVDH